ncbi:MAG: glutamine amidotransferase [Collinsella sp.]|nr:glutamine amidotransferase [Collinsella sp.]
MAQTTIEILYPEFGNQAGDNGNAMYLRACLPNATFIETAFGDEPAFVTRDDLALVLLCGMTERQQVRALEALMPHRDRIERLVDAGTPMLFTGNAAELLGNMIVTPEGRGITGLGLFNFVTHQLTPQRFTGVGLGRFTPEPGAESIDVVGFKMQFTQMEGDNSSCAFCELEQGFGLNKKSSREGFRRRNLIATWFLGPLLPVNPPFTRWLLAQMGEEGADLAHAEVAERAYAQRVKDFAVPGMDI